MSLFLYLTCFFVDDSLLFQQDTLEGVLALKSVILQYEQIWGQKVSLANSAVYFSKHVHLGDCDALAEMLGVDVSNGKENIWGYPTLWEIKERDF